MTDCLCDITLISINSSNILPYNNLSKILPAIESNNIGRQFFNFCLSPFFWTGTIFVFFYSIRNFLLSKQEWKINFRVLQIELHHILVIGILIISSQWVLFGSRFLTIFIILSVEKFFIHTASHVFLWESLEVHCYFWQ